MKKDNKKEEKIPPDFTIKSVPENDDEEAQIFKIAKRGIGKAGNRRSFLNKATNAFVGLTGLSAIGSIFSSCEDTAKVTIREDGQECTCHVVCTCDVDDDDHTYESEYDSTYNGSDCTCDTVCYCNTVCTCNTEGGSSGGGSTYWYPN